MCYSTPNYSKITSLCINSLKSINVTNIHHLLDTPPTNLTYKTGFQSDLWYYCVRNKISHLINMLKIHKTAYNIDYYIFTDCDIIYHKNNVHEWSNLEKYIQETGKDIYFMRENTSTDINSGLFIINKHSVDKFIVFFTEVLSLFDKSNKADIPFGDQSIINKLKHKIKYGYIPNEYAIFGTTIFNKNKALFHHAVCCNDTDDKIIQIEDIITQLNALSS